MDYDVKLLAEEGGCGNVGGDKERVFLALFHQHPDCHRYVRPYE